MEMILEHPVSSTRKVADAVSQNRCKDPRSTFLERIFILDQADREFSHLPQPLVLGEAMGFLFERLSLPVLPEDELVGRVFEKVPDSDEEQRFQDIMSKWGRCLPGWFDNRCHLCLDWDSLVEHGLSGLEARAARNLQKKKRSHAEQHEIHFLDGMVRVFQAFRACARRWSCAAEEAGKSEAAHWCRSIADNPPATFPEALQLTWIVGLAMMTLCSGSSALTFARFDQFLLPFYDRDIAAGTLARARAGELIDDFFLKIYALLGRGEHQMGRADDGKSTGWARNATYDAATYVVVGGRRMDGSPVANELTELALQTAAHELKNPSVILRYTPDLPDSIWFEAVELMRNNASLFVYNDDVMIPALQSWGVEEEDAVGYSLHGCNDPHISGRQGSLVEQWINLPSLFLEVFHDRTEGPASADELIELLRSRFSQYLREDLTPRLDEIVQSQPPGFLRPDDGFLDGPVDQAQTWLTGGVKYHYCLIQLGGVATVVDSLAAIETAASDNKELGLADLQEAAEADFNGFERLRARLGNLPKFGNDERLPDGVAEKLIDGLCDDIARIDDDGSGRLYRMMPCISTDMNHIRMGEKTGATPDGRLAGTPVSENQSASAGQDQNGLTALLNSLSRIPFHRITGGTLNLRVHPSLISGESGMIKFAAALRTYFKNGGLQVQVSCVGKEILLAAKENPDAHRNLTVRITGYSAYFTDMTDAAQDEVISRTEFAG
ncbi:MAG: pyruvate formate lyase family protein [Planctomycetota bacterium]|jgi:formate C-acetyltransferase|nr:pyruvate formate lyase family protein [Planctomycetota bacterium]